MPAACLSEHETAQLLAVCQRMLELLDAAREVLACDTGPQASVRGPRHAAAMRRLAEIVKRAETEQV